MESSLIRIWRTPAVIYSTTLFRYESRIYTWRTPAVIYSTTLFRYESRIYTWRSSEETSVAFCTPEMSISTTKLRIKPEIWKDSEKSPFSVCLQASNAPTSKKLPFFPTDGIFYFLDILKRFPSNLLSENPWSCDPCPKFNDRHLEFDVIAAICRKNCRRSKIDEKVHVFSVFEIQDFFFWLDRKSTCLNSSH